MKEFSLWTKDGKFVVNVIVPPFTSPAEVVQWGTRFFVWSSSQQRYIEGMCFMANVTADDDDSDQ